MDKSKPTFNSFPVTASRPETQMDAVTSPLDIPLVLSKIFLYLLPSGDLETTRQVNYLWRRETIKLYRHHSCSWSCSWSHVTLIDFNEMKKYKLENPDNFIQVRKYHQCFRFYLPNIEDSTGKLSIFKSQILQSVENISSNIKTLGLHLTEGKVTDFKFLGQLLNKFPQLNCLSLDILIYDWNEMQEFNWSKDFKIDPLKNLRKLCLVFSDIDFSPVDKIQLSEICKNLIKLGPNIKEITFHADDCHPEFFTIYFQEMLKHQEVWKTNQKAVMPFRALSSFNLFNIPKGNFKLFLEFSQPIKTLVFCTNSIKDLDYSVEMFLKKHANTLAFITLICEANEELDLASLYKIILPNMPMLTTLELKVTNKNDKFNLCAGDIFNIQELFMMGGDKFMVKFPSLRRLNFGGLHSGLLPTFDKKDLFFLQITEFKIDKNGDDTKHNNDFINHLSKMFPNVNNKAFNKIREKSYK